jgi:hypothetical protein
MKSFYIRFYLKLFKNIMLKVFNFSYEWMFKSNLLEIDVCEYK